jgi:CubicO group peptidase (beta-lactamase class C family)
MRLGIFSRSFPLIAMAAALAAPLTAQRPYYPDRGSWQTLTPEALGMDGALVTQAIEIAIAGESQAPTDLEAAHYLSFGREPHGDAIGPFKTRGPQSGLIVRRGYLVAEWGDTERVDMTFSVTKSFLSTTVGLAWDDGLIHDLHDPVRSYFAPIELPPGDGEPGEEEDGTGAPRPQTLFDSSHNRQITWDHLLRQVSDWEGTLWGKPDWADRPGPDPRENKERVRSAPGTAYKYNDVRVNLLALATMQVVREPLPELLKRRVMDPIGASNLWRWHGYRNSWVNVDGRMVQSVSGGGHWGGGMYISARDQARFGLLTLRRGNWNGEQLLSDDWFTLALTPGAVNPTYGFMNYFLNRPNEEGRKRYPSAPDNAFAHLGNGTNLVYVDPDNDLVVVARWIDGQAIDPFLAKIIESIETSTTREGG